jgi:hypothetical protein
MSFFQCRSTIASVHGVSGRSVDFQLRLDHAPQQSDEMCYDPGVCRVFKSETGHSRHFWHLGPDVRSCSTFSDVQLRLLTPKSINIALIVTA